MKPNTKKSAVSLILLIGALSFSLSDWQGHQSPVVSRVSFSSLGTECRIGDTNHCHYKVGDEKNPISADVYTSIKPNEDETNTASKEDAATKKPKSYELTVTVKNIEAKCNAGCENGSMREETTEETYTISNLKEVENYAQKLFRTSAHNLEKKVKEAAEQARRKELCLPEKESDNRDNEDDGEEDDLLVSSKYRTSRLHRGNSEMRKILSCRIKKLRHMKLAKATDYYEEHIQPELESLAMSENRMDRFSAQTLMRSLGSTRNPFIHDSLSELQNLSLHNERSLQLQQQSRMVSLLPANDPRRLALKSALAQEQQSWSQYLQAQYGYASNLYPDPRFGDFDYSAALIDNLRNYQSDLERAFPDIFNRNSASAGGTGNSFFPTSNNPRTARGSWTPTSYPPNTSNLARTALNRTGTPIQPSGNVAHPTLAAPVPATALSPMPSTFGAGAAQ